MAKSKTTPKPKKSAPDSTTCPICGADLADAPAYFTRTDGFRQCVKPCFVKA